MRRTVTLAVAALAAAALPAHADAAKARKKVRTYAYDVSYRGSGYVEYHANDAAIADGNPYDERTISATLIWHGRVGKVIIRGSDVVAAGRAVTDHLSADVHDAVTHYSPDDPPSSVVCDGIGSWPVSFGKRTIDTPDDLLVPLDGSINLVVRPFDPATTLTGIPCDDGSETGFVPPEVEGPPPLGQGVWDAAFNLPKEALGAGKIIQQVKATEAQTHRDPCPLYVPGVNAVDRCQIYWLGQVTFKRRALPKRWQK